LNYTALSRCDLVDYIVYLPATTPSLDRGCASVILFVAATISLMACQGQAFGVQQITYVVSGTCCNLRERIYRAFVKGQINVHIATQQDTIRDVSQSLLNETFQVRRTLPTRHRSLPLRWLRACLRAHLP
jgi:hypothetical protein